MEKLNQRIHAFSQLGEFLSQFTTTGIEKHNLRHNDMFFEAMVSQIKIAHELNGWFTKSNILFSLENLSKQLKESSLKDYVSSFSLTPKNKTIAVVMAGNVPLVGFHDFLSVLLMGHNILIKQSSNDKSLLPLIAKFLEHVEPTFKGKIRFTESKLENFDAIIATGSTNTARYFEYYFKNYPSIIRKSRNSVAVLTGHESNDELNGLADDIFKYFGLGCRSVSKLFVPIGYDFDPLFNSLYNYKDLINNAKYANNYDYNKAVYLMSLFDVLENGFIMLKEDKNYASPIATLFYEYYEDTDNLKARLYNDKESIQCIVSNNFVDDEIQFGHSQMPSLTDFADGINTLEFINTL